MLQTRQESPWEGQVIKELLRNECPVPTETEQCGSKELALYANIIKHMVKTKGLKTSLKAQNCEPIFTLSEGQKV